MFLQPNAARTETFEYGGFAAVEKRLRNEWVHRRMKGRFQNAASSSILTPASGGDGWDTPKMRRGVDIGDSWWLVRLVFWATVIFVGIRLAWALVLMM